jgi:hypothetical protein
MAALKNARHEQFAQCVVSGMTNIDSYRAVYPKSLNWKYDSVACRAHDLIKDPRIIARIQELHEQAASAAVLTRQARMELLTNIAMDETQHTRSRLNAIDILNKMDGDYVKRIEANISGDIDATAAQIEAILDGDDSGDDEALSDADEPANGGEAE